MTEDLDVEAVQWLAERCDVRRCGSNEAGFAVALAGASALVVRTYTRVDAGMLAAAPALRVVARAGVGLDNIDLGACRERGIEVVHTPAANTRAVVEYVLALVLDEIRPRAGVAHAPDEREWSRLRRDLVGARGLAELTFGVLGLGRIGSQVGRALRALDARVLYHDLLDLGEPFGCERVGRDDLFTRADVLTIHVDGRRANRGLVGAALLARARDDAILINTSRGFVVDPAALSAFLRSRPRARAVLDVHEPEPISPDSPLLGLPNARLLPHLASGTMAAKRAMSWVVRDVWRVLCGERPEFPARPEPE